MTSNTRVRSSLLAVIMGAALALPASMAGCHTTEGAGRDVSGLGRGISDTASQTRQAVFGSEEWER